MAKLKLIIKEINQGFVNVEATDRDTAEEMAWTNITTEMLFGRTVAYHISKGKRDGGYLSRTFKQLLVKNNMPLIRYHDLRHSFSTEAHNSGMPVKWLSKILGHSSTAVTLDMYVHDETD